MSLSPRSYALSGYTCTSPIHQSWESALQDVIGVLKIQYRSDADVCAFLCDLDKTRQLQYSTAAKMEWNRRVIKEELDSGIHSPPRSRRIAKEVAIDYIRRYLDGEEERLTMLSRIKQLQLQKDDTLMTVMEYEKEIAKLKDENSKSGLDNIQLSDEGVRLKADNDDLRTDNSKLREENQSTREENDQMRGENTKLRQENKKLRQENQDLRDENGALRSENQKVRSENQRIRDECEEVRSENIKVRGENQSLRDENQEVRSENLNLRDNNTLMRNENDRYREKNIKICNDNKNLTQDNLELHAREDEMKMLVNVMQSLLSGNTGVTSSFNKQSHDSDEE